MRKQLLAGLAGLTLVLAGCAPAGHDSAGPDPVPAETHPNSPAPTPEVVGPPPAQVEPGTVTVNLEVTTTGEASVFYGDYGSSSSVDLAPGQSWSLVVEDVDPYDGYTLTVSESTYLDDAAEVTCKVYADGVLVDESKATGAGSMANCMLPMDL